MREMIGRMLCSGLGAFYMTGAVPLFTFGETGKQLWAFIEATVAQVANAVGIPEWLALSAVAPFAIGGPLALVWLIAGKGINRTLWFIAGIAAAGLFFMVT
jgi:hypothetical protein